MLDDAQQKKINRQCIFFEKSGMRAVFFVPLQRVMNEHKIINDPVFGFIKIRRGLLYDIVQHPLFQRLNRIVQLGLASVVYPGARHTRFQHSLGALHLMSEAVKSLTEKGIYIFDMEEEAVQAAIGAFGDWIKAETLADSIEAKDGLEQFDLNGHKTGIDVERI